MKTSVPRSGSIFSTAEDAREIFSPDELSEEQRMFAELTQQFSAGEVVPLAGDVEDMKPGVMQELMRKAGELGLLSADVSSDLGGMGLDLPSSLLITENLCDSGSFAVTHSDHTVFGILPIALFGNDEQKAKYLPNLVSGQKLAAYALTEAASGSDAMAAQTRATYNAEGEFYVLNGSKQFITNSGFADVIVTFAKLNGNLAAFLVDRESEGLSLGSEEKKTGIGGSSTRSINYDEVKVPAANLLFGENKGHHVAFNVLNLGRLKLAALCVGTSKVALRHAVGYALERKQFDQPIIAFGLIQEKLARMSAMIYAAESALYRSAVKIEETLAEARKSGPDGACAIERHAFECSINKVLASEVLGFVADETVQIFGGYGYIREYPADNIYRNARINRIFAGTNEINRLVVARALISSVPKDEIAVPSSIELPALNGANPTERQERSVAIAKRALHMLLRLAIKTHGPSIEKEQEVLGLIADLAIQLYALESALLRTQKAIDVEGDEEASIRIALLQSYGRDAASILHRLCSDAFAALSNPDELQAHVRLVNELITEAPQNLIHVRRRIATHMGREGRYAPR